MQRECGGGLSPFEGEHCAVRTDRKLERMQREAEEALGTMNEMLGYSAACRFFARAATVRAEGLCAEPKREQEKREETVFVRVVNALSNALFAIAELFTKKD